MKSLKIIIVSILIAGTFSCEDKLELSPITEKVTNNFYNNEDEVESAIYGVYAQLQNNGLYGLDMIAVGEVSGEDTFEEISANDGGRFGQLDDFSTIPQNDLVGDIWRESYIAIQRANTVLNRIKDITYADDNIKKARVAEMKFIRALVYFNLVRIYGDVPLVTSETTDPAEAFGKGRVPKNEVVNQIKQDINDAIQNLPENKEAGRPAKGAAEALLANVHLWLGDYTQAANLYESVVSSGEYELVNEVDNIFGVENEGNSEVLFEVQFASGLDGNSEGSRSFSQFRPSGTTANAKGHNLPTSAFVELYEPGDERKSVYVGTHPANINYFSLKFDENFDPDDGGSDFIVIRFSDVILKYAEALNESGQTEEAVEQLNKIRNRAGLSNISATTQSEVREAIKLERRLELINEGHRWFDLKRYGTAVKVMNDHFASIGRNITINENNLVLPIPQSQIDTDPEAMEQNSGY